MIAKLKRRLWRHGRRLYFLAFQRGRYNRLTLETVLNRPFLILPEVFNPAIFLSGVFLCESLPDLHDKMVLDMGTGSGIGAVFAALNGAYRVTATDINPHAVRCVRINALLNGVEDRVHALESDVFSAVHGQTFDLVLFNPPFYKGTPEGWLDHAWRGDDVVQRFADGLQGVLKSTGSALIVLSTDGETAAFLDVFRAAALHVTVFATRDVGNEVLTVYQLKPAEHLPDIRYPPDNPDSESKQP